MVDHHLGVGWEHLWWPPMTRAWPIRRSVQRPQGQRHRFP
jgi:hypothetical protein